MIAILIYLFAIVVFIGVTRKSINSLDRDLGNSSSEEETLALQKARKWKVFKFYVLCTMAISCILFLVYFVFSIANSG
jgi:hypothetical protein